MFKFLLPLAGLLSLLAGQSVAQTVSMPESIKVEKGRLGSVRIQYDGEDVRWFVSPELDVFREYSVDARDVRLRVQGFKDGKYQVMAVTCKAGKLSDLYVCWVLLGDQAPPTPTPGPPDPKPPTPPDPKPPDPKPPAPNPLPADPVAGRLADAFKLDPAPVADKVKSCQGLSAFYLAMATHVRANEISPTGVKYSVNTVGELLGDYAEAGRGLFKPDEVKGVRKQLSVEVSGAVGTDSTRAIDPNLRETLAKLFELLALVLKLLS